MVAKQAAKAHQFGGQWTSAKLSVLAQYLKAYTTALKDKPSAGHPFRKAYIDAFAGTGYRTLASEGEGAEALLFPDLAEPAPQELLDGSARLALKTTPRFDRYIFIEWSAKRCAALEALKQEFPELAKDTRIEQEDANTKIQELCRKNWRSSRAVLFLDPYGMQVEWETIEAIAGTKAIDLWLLFPLGIGVNRLLTRTGTIPQSWQRRLDRLLGTQAWRDDLYEVQTTSTLFGEEKKRVVKVAVEKIGRYFNDRLKMVFAGVADEPGVLRNSTNSPLYLLCFAAGNAKGAPIALKIANHLLKEVR